jgi:hypothetical protein
MNKARPRVRKPLGLNPTTIRVLETNDLTTVNGGVIQPPSGKTNYCSDLCNIQVLW